MLSSTAFVPVIHELHVSTAADDRKHAHPIRRLMQGQACAVMVLALLTGCAGQKYLVMRDVPANPLAMQLQLTSKNGPQVSTRTESLLRRYDLLELYKSDIAACLESMQSLAD